MPVLCLSIQDEQRKVKIEGSEIIFRGPLKQTTEIQRALSWLWAGVVFAVLCFFDRLMKGQTMTTSIT